MRQSQVTEQQSNKRLMHMLTTKCGMGAVHERRALHMQTFKLIHQNFSKGQYVAFGGLSIYGILHPYTVFRKWRPLYMQYLQMESPFLVYYIVPFCVSGTKTV